MRVKNIVFKIMLALGGISLFALFILLFSGCATTLDNASRNLNQYNIEIDYNESLQTLTCNQEIIYINKTDTTLNYVAFHLYPNAFREESSFAPVSFANQHNAYPNGMSYGNIDINSVSIMHNTATYCGDMHNTLPTYGEIANLVQNNNLTSYQYFVGGEDGNILYILFPDALYPNEDISINIDFTVNLPNVHHRFGYGNNTVNVANFYPIACVFNNGEFDTSTYHYNGDPFYSDMGNYNITLTAPADFIIANTGYVKDRKKISLQHSEEENVLKNVYKIEAKVVRDFAIVLSKEFNVLTEKFQNVEVKYYYFSDPSPEESLEISVNALKTFSKMIGNYPYSTLSVVESNFVHGGMEFPNLVYISNEYTSNKQIYRQIIVHEIAHQWWYNLVGNSEVSHSWLDEGLTEYSTALFFELNPQYEISKEHLIGTAYISYSLFIQLYEKVYGEVDTTMNRDLHDFNSEQEYTQIAYVKGMLLFDSVREILGYKKFIKCLQFYFSENIYKNATPADLIRCFEKASGVSLESFFSAWIDGNVILLR